MCCRAPNGRCAAGSTAVGVACGASERRPPMKPLLPFNSFCAGFRRSRRVRHVHGRGLVVYAPASSHGAAAVVGRGFYRRRRAPSRLAADLHGNDNNKTRREEGRKESGISSESELHLFYLDCQTELDGFSIKTALLSRTFKFRVSFRRWGRPVKATMRSPSSSRVPYHGCNVFRCRRL